MCVAMGTHVANSVAMWVAMDALWPLMGYWQFLFVHICIELYTCTYNVIYEYVCHICICVSDCISYYLYGVDINKHKQLFK